MVLPRNATTKQKENCLPTPNLVVKRIENVCTETCTWMLIASLFTLAQNMYHHFWDKAAAEVGRASGWLLAEAWWVSEMSWWGFKGLSQWLTEQANKNNQPVFRTYEWYNLTSMPLKTAEYTLFSRHVGHLPGLIVCSSKNELQKFFKGKVIKTIFFDQWNSARNT